MSHAARSGSSVAVKELHPSELVRRRLAEWYVEGGLEPPAALAKVAEMVLTALPHGPVNVWRHADDGSLRVRPVTAAARRVFPPPRGAHEAPRCIYAASLR